MWQVEVRGCTLVIRSFYCSAVLSRQAYPVSSGGVPDCPMQSGIDPLGGKDSRDKKVWDQWGSPKRHPCDAGTTGTSHTKSGHQPRNRESYPGAIIHHCYGCPTSGLLDDDAFPRNQSSGLITAE